MFGGLEVPDYKLYYWAAQLQWMARWFKGTNVEEMGVIGDEPRQGALIWRLFRIHNTEHSGTGLLSVALKCWNKCAQTTSHIPKYTPEITLVGLPPGTAQEPPFSLQQNCRQGQRQR